MKEKAQKHRVLPIRIQLKRSIEHFFPFLASSTGLHPESLRGLRYGIAESQLRSQKWNSHLKRTILFFLLTIEIDLHIPKSNTSLRHPVSSPRAPFVMQLSTLSRGRASKYM